MSKKLSHKECSENIMRRVELLQLALKSPSQVSDKIIKACSSQVRLSELNAPELNVYSISRNTMYKYANNLLNTYNSPDGKNGYAYLDWLRKEVQLSASEKIKKRSIVAKKDRLNSKLNDMNNLLIATEKAMLAIEKAYWDIFRAIKSELKFGNLEPATRARLANLINHHSETYKGVFRKEVQCNEIINIHVNKS